jgi:hypothetical protein
MIRKNKKFIDPRYFMDEKMELNEGLGDELRAGGNFGSAIKRGVTGPSSEEHELLGDALHAIGEFKGIFNALSSGDPGAQEQAQNAIEALTADGSSLSNVYLALDRADAETSDLAEANPRLWELLNAIDEFILTAKRYKWQPSKHFRVEPMLADIEQAAAALKRDYKL